jgi:4-hydroxy-3-methylbut-2-enyl diphosphate reductase IspH
MEMIQAGHPGMCIGVKNVIAPASEAARREAPTIPDDVVHNEMVLEEVRAHRIDIGQQAARVDMRTVMITAGTSTPDAGIDAVEDGRQQFVYR